MACVLRLLIIFRSYYEGLGAYDEPCDMAAVSRAAEDSMWPPAGSGRQGDAEAHTQLGATRDTDAQEGHGQVRTSDTVTLPAAGRL